jgi:hypothetical protein
MTRLSDEEIEERLADREGWERSGDAIVKQFDNGDFKGSVGFVNRLTPEAEEMNHHPPTSRSRGRRSRSPSRRTARAASPRAISSSRAVLMCWASRYTRRVTA